MNLIDAPLVPFLDPGEKLLWSGQPKQGLRLQTSDFFMIPFSLMWGGFAICWEAAALGAVFAHSHAGHPKEPSFILWLFPLWGVPFVLMGFYIIFGRFFFDAASRSRTWYGVTDRRVMILKTLGTKKITSFDHLTQNNLNLVERGDRSGDVLLGSSMSPFPLPSGWPGGSRYVAPGFYLLPEARTVYNLIRDVQQQARKI